MNKTFQSISPAQVGRSVFDLSYRHLLTGDMGKLYPVMCREMVPGDVFDFSLDLVIRFQPMTAPLLHKVDAYVHYFFVPYRILWHDDDPITGSWEDFITGGVDGTSAPTLPTLSSTVSAKALGDYFGFPVGALYGTVERSAFPRYAYNLIYNEFYRDQTAISEVTLTQPSVLKRAWEKDYFTSALPTQQRGTAPALPISGTIDVDTTGTPPKFGDTVGERELEVINAARTIQGISNWGATASARFGTVTGLEVDLSGATTFDVADLRLATQTQVYLERNNRAGARYTEWLKAHFNSAPRDDRLDRPEYFGGLRTPVIFSEVLQTSATDAALESGGTATPQGNMAGHGISGGRKRIGSYRAQEYGLVMAILSVMPEPLYQEGLDRQWIKSTRYDFYAPEFANLSEQPIYNGELYLQGTTADDDVFGYQEIWSEMRSSRSIVTGGMRDDFDYWHMSRQFGSLPSLDQTFIECTPRDDPAFAAPSEDQLIIHVGNGIRAVRPLPIHSQPGYMDHP